MPTGVEALCSPRRAVSLPHLALMLIGALTLWRFGFGLFDATELSTDEAQYWVWGQAPSLGAYSKPPLIGWLIGAVTTVFGASVATVRLPAVFLHLAVALAIFALGRRLATSRVAAVAALGYATAPAVTLGSALMTTDTPLLLAFALALIAQCDLAQARAQGRSQPGKAAALGLAVALGALAKYAMLYGLLGMALAAVLSPRWRIGRGDLALAAGVALIVLAPHLVWLLDHGFVTFRHLSDTATGPVRGLDPLEPLRFLASQFAVFGPILFPAAVLAGARRSEVGLIALAVVPIAIVSLQAFGGKALANWAVLSLVPAALLAAPLLAARPRLLAVSLTLGGALALAVPAARALAPELRLPDGREVFARYLGHAALAEQVLALARAHGAPTLVAADRDLLADLAWFGRDTRLALRAVPPQGRPRNHWEMTAPFRAQTDALPVLLVQRSGAAMPCPAAPVLARIAPTTGFARGSDVTLSLLSDASCLEGPGRP
ncbi:4-amino-4-deoxy-L-arabinose transferase-like glycosyltransferase [Rhodobacter viridis]|uniref:4-amino-4-deoxy-L-arabinose transferase-like glycosyltransferase n=1 Tax=Rhodobacter viridis TaxID=1054202 RepID=A0A318TYN8_9RHOB|nr:glycosyltransferase family 39 protein [Rhodobacter viridis]PYF08128.1 4-amino-4-deoxy-L-arabinose transferase-like glycosyltransferase [Rhodobacter viridis]